MHCPIRPDSMGWRLKEAYSGLAERLACDGPVGHAQEGTSQHGEIRPSNRFQIKKGNRKKREEGRGRRGEEDWEKSR
jgi:hypothetical protein